MRRIAFLLAAMALAGVWAAPRSEISVRLAMDNSIYVDGERVRAVVSVDNGSTDPIDARTAGSPSKLILELFRASDRGQQKKLSDKPFTAGFALLSGEGQKLETFFADHFKMEKSTRYLARAVLVHDGYRYESAMKSFDTIPGLPCGEATQLFANNRNLRRHFELVHYERDRISHLFLKATDGGISSKRWQTTDLGPLLRVTEPRISVQPSGEVIVLHRATQDTFLRTVFWSLPTAFELHERETMADPDVAGAERVKELYRDSGGLEPVKKAWWKFW